MFSQENHATSGTHFSLPIGSVFLNKYQVVQVAGSGNFARVYECINMLDKQRVAVKILKKGFERDADFECSVLRGVGRSDPNDEEGVVKLVERTEYQGLAVIVFKLKGAPLRNSKLPMTDSDIRQVARDVSQALSFLHFRVKAVHTDLKPENILAEIQGNAAGRKWSLCDLGSASFYKDGQLDRDLITTRPYRAPEVVLQRGWCFPSDAWSLGCILYELRTGKKLFDCHSDGDHLRLMEERLGPIPSSMKGSVRVPAAYGTRASSQLQQELRNEPEFLSLLMGLLEYEPSKRLRCDHALQHDYLRHSSSSKCGAEGQMETMMRRMSMDSNNENAMRPKAQPATTTTATANATSARSGSSGTGLSAMPNNYKNLIPGSLASSSSRGPKKYDAQELEMQNILPSSHTSSEKYFVSSHQIGMHHHGSSGSFFPGGNNGSSLPNSAPNSANSSPRHGYMSNASSTRSSPRNSHQLVSPAYPTTASSGNNNTNKGLPLSYRLTYL